MSTLVLLLLIALPALAQKGHPKEPYTGSKEFEQLKMLKGSWKGEMPMPDTEKKQPITAEYRLTSNDSAIVETLFPGTPQEMVSIYHDRNGELIMTHYCALGNQPIMTLKKSEPNKIVLDYSRLNPRNLIKEPHMHSLSITLKDNKNIKHEWAYYEEGKRANATVIELTRTK